MTDNYYKGRIFSVVGCSFGKKLDLVIILSREKTGIPNFNQHNLVSIVLQAFISGFTYSGIGKEVSISSSK